VPPKPVGPQSYPPAPPAINHHISPFSTALGPVKLAGDFFVLGESQVLENNSPLGPPRLTNPPCLFQAAVAWPSLPAHLPVWVPKARGRTLCGRFSNTGLPGTHKPRDTVHPPNVSPCFLEKIPVPPNFFPPPTPPIAPRSGSHNLALKRLTGKVSGSTTISGPGLPGFKSQREKNVFWKCLFRRWG